MKKVAVREFDAARYLDSEEAIAEYLPPRSKANSSKPPTGCFS